MGPSTSYDEEKKKKGLTSDRTLVHTVWQKKVKMHVARKAGDRDRRDVRK
jgi:hypothetical protein